MPQHCTGALTLHEKLGRPKWRLPFAGAGPVLCAPLEARRAGRELRTHSNILFQVTSTRLTNQRTNGRRRQPESESHGGLGARGEMQSVVDPYIACRESCSFLTTAACGGLRPAPDCRPRRALLHLSYSSAPSCSDGAFVTHAPEPTLDLPVACDPPGSQHALDCL